MKVAIIGAGVIGQFTAYYLSKEGIDVSVYDQRKKGDRDYASYGNAGLVVPSHIVPLAAPGMTKKAIQWMFNKESPLGLNWKSLSTWQWLYRFNQFSTKENVRENEALLYQMNKESLLAYEEFSKEHSLKLTKGGLQMLCSNEEELVEEELLGKKGKLYGMPYSKLSHENLEKQHGRKLNTLAAIHFLEDASLDAREVMETLEKANLAQNVKFNWECKGSKIDHNAFDKIIYCLGANGRSVLRRFGHSVLLTSGRGFSFIIKGEALVKKPMIIVKHKIAVVPVKEGTKVSGNMLIGDYGKNIVSSRIKGIKKALKEVFEWEGDIEDVWTGNRPCSVDGLPIIGYLDDSEKYLINGGHGMMGVSLAPYSANQILCLISDNKKNNYKNIHGIQRFK